MVLGTEQSSGQGYADAREGDRRRAWVLLGAVLTPVVLWAVAILALEPVRFSVLSSRYQIGEEGASAFARLLGALVLFFFPYDEARVRLRAIASGFIVLGVGGFVFGYLPAIADHDLSLARTMYASLAVSTLAGVLFVCGLHHIDMLAVPTRPIIAATAVLGIFAILFAGDLPELADPAQFATAVAESDAPIRALSTWHWILSIVPLGLTALATVGAARHFEHERWGGWLIVAMGLLAGSQFHNLFWPSAYTATMTSANVLRLAFAAVVALGGILELRRVAAERARSLAESREYADRLSELGRLKADFTAMAAHELGNPLAAIRRSAEVLARASPRPDQEAVIRSITVETDLLTSLIADVRTSAIVERDDFKVDLKPVPVTDLLADAAAFARTLGEDHPLSVSEQPGVSVWADGDRIGQVLRNLLVNACRYSPSGAEIALAATSVDGVVRFEVTDRGKGIDPGDAGRIFDKFERGRNPDGKYVGGLGLGLYLSRRIVRAHGYELTVSSTPGEGSCFTFELEKAS